MRFVHYYPGAMAGSGVTVALWGWVNALRRAGHDILVLHAPIKLNGDSESFVSDRVEEIPTAAIPHRGTARWARHPSGLSEHLRPTDVLVLHEGWVTANLVAAEVAHRSGVPYIVVPHGVYEPAWRRYLKPPRIVRDKLERRLLERALAAHLFFDSESGPLHAVAPDARVVVAPTGTDAPQERWRGGGGYLAWVGRYDPYHKGLDVLVEAVAQLPAERRPYVRLRGYDYEGGKKALSDLVAARPEVRNWIDIGGPISGQEKRRFLLEADGYVLPSRWESHSMALLEVLGLGVPTLVSGSLHVAPVLAKRSAAVLAGSTRDELAFAILELRREAHRFSEPAASLVASEFSWAAIIPPFVRQVEVLRDARH